jgi:hypothetical protein
MGEDFRTMLAGELADVAEPPVGDLVEESVRTGRRMRAARRVRAGAVAAAVAVLAGAVAVAGSHFAPPTATAPTPVAPAATAGKRVKATPEGLLELLTRTLPPGKTSHYAASAQGLTVQAYLDAGRGPGVIQLSVGRDGEFDSQARADADLRAGCAAKQSKTCRIADDLKVGPVVAEPSGVRYQVVTISDNCIENTMVSVRQPSGTWLRFTLPTCLAWDGRQNKPSPAALTVPQAVRVGSDPRWGATLDPGLVAAGAKHFPHLSSELGR